MMIKNNKKVWDHCHYKEKYRSTAIGIWNVKNKTSKDICVVFHIRSNYDYHFKIKIYYESLKDILIAYVKVLKGT